MDKKKETFDSAKAKEAQNKYCTENNAPNFANGGCFSCGRDIYTLISVEEAGRSLITGCPVCHRSFCD